MGASLNLMKALRKGVDACRVSIRGVAGRCSDHHFSAAGQVANDASNVQLIATDGAQHPSALSVVVGTQMGGFSEASC